MQSKPTFWQFLKLLHKLYKDRRTPFATRMLPILAVVYLLMPIDFIPDIVPLVGWLDDLGMVPLLLYVAYRYMDMTALQDVFSKDQKRKDVINV